MCFYEKASPYHMHQNKSYFFFPPSDSDTQAQAFAMRRYLYCTQFGAFCRGIAFTVLWRAPAQDGVVRYDDPTTWPKDWTARDIEMLLHLNLAKPGTSVSYQSLATLHKIGDTASLKLLLQQYVKPPPPKQVDVEAYLSQHVNNVVDSASMPLQERSTQLEALHRALSAQSRREVANVAFCSSPRGTGKTQFLKWFVSAKRADAMKCGRVIVRCCDKASHEGSNNTSWILGVMEGTATSVEGGLCELIRSHVETVTGFPQDPSKYSEPNTAYTTWINETARFFGIPKGKENVDPLVILDTCEILAEHEHKSLVHKTSQSRYTLLEALCSAIPSPFSMFVIGCVAEVRTLMPTVAVTDIGPLLPLSEEGHQNAITESWKAEADEAMRLPLFHWAGGVPRLLRLAHSSQRYEFSVANGSSSAFTSCFERYRDVAKAQYPIQEKWFPQAYTCMLASSTKAAVQGSGNIPVNPAWAKSNLDLTFIEATRQSMGFYDPSTCRFMVPPITFVDEVVGRRDVPILPSQLYPFLMSKVVESANQRSSEDYGTLFEKPLLYAMYARYLLAYWEDSTSPWISLAKVFAGAVQPKQMKVLMRYEVNLSNGVVEAGDDPLERIEDAAMHCGEDADHDAYIWCREKSRNKSTTFSIPILMRSRAAHRAHRKQTRQAKSSEARAPLLLVVGQDGKAAPSDTTADVVVIHADAMSSHSWLSPPA